jgi:hypothetical protein
MREQLNYTCMLKNLLKLLHLNLGHLVGFVCVCVVLFYFMYPLWWDNYRTSEAPSPGLESEMDTQIIKTEILLHLNLEVFCFFGFYKKIFYFSFYFIFI